jgi:tRNA-specific adenosine deaminase 3
MQAPSTTVWEYTQPMKTRISMRPPTLHLLICPTKVVSLADLYKLLLEYPPFCSSAESWAYPLEIKEITVPLLAPTSPSQAEMWSTNYWPTFYRKTNPFGAHPATIARAEDDLHNPVDENMGVEQAMALARKAARETQSLGYGAGPGCVVLERVDNKTEIIAVAGDARQKPLGSEMMTDFPQGAACTGNVMGHAVMRAVGMVGRKRLRVASQPITTRAAKAERNFENCGLEHDEEARDAFFLDLPITDLEEEHFVKDNIKPDGYLCLRLEVFLTHEPCVMCSMALVHSRVGRVIFTNRMPQTGGLTSEMVSNVSGPPGLGYGLCWRKELNWQFMCWELMESKDQPRESGKSTGNVNRADSPAQDNDDDEEEDMLIDDNANANSFASSTHV